jgi:hypothetical protein
MERTGPRKTFAREVWPPAWTAVPASCWQTRRRPVRYPWRMGAKPVDGRDNRHAAKSYGNPLGVECGACKRRVLLPLDRLGNLDGDMRPLLDRRFKCPARAAARRASPVVGQFEYGTHDP